MSATTHPETLARPADPLGSAVACGPLVLLPSAAAVLLWHAAPWQLLWGLATAIYLGLKWLTFASQPPPAGTSWERMLGYLLFWPGMNAAAFWDKAREAPRPDWTEWLFAASKLASGLGLVALVVPAVLPHHPLAAGWAAMVGLIFVLHFGLFHLLSLAWRAAGVAAEPIMQWPILATSLADFWGRRWNLAFRDLAFTYLLKPLTRRWGAIAATLTVFFASGLVHELVITVPVGGGWGGPTIYFLLQGIGLLLERSDAGRRIGLGEGLLGRAFCLLITLGPVGLLFPEPFVTRGILPLVTGGV